MSGFHTHMLIGAVGGLAFFKTIEHLDGAALYLPVEIAGNSIVVPPVAIGIGAIILSAYLALWPDIDEPGTHVSNQAQHFLWVLGGIIGLIVMLALSQSIILVLAGVAAGAVIGLLAGLPFLSLLRFISGGHRRLTHSLVVGAGLFILAGATYLIGMLPVALPAFALAWGQLLHLAGDVETRSGVPLFYPLSRYDFHLFPYALARFGEPIAASFALMSGILFILWR
jgi:membrane-bound metal-dependent hydrolase YbcI (DUF457 family)